MSGNLPELLALAVIELELSSAREDQALLKRLRAGPLSPADADAVVEIMGCLADEHERLAAARAPKRAESYPLRAIA